MPSKHKSVIGYMMIAGRGNFGTVADAVLHFSGLGVWLFSGLCPSSRRLHAAACHCKVQV